MSYRLLSDKQLEACGAGDSWASKAYALLEEQIAVWPGCNLGFAGLEDVERREIEVSGDRIIIQNNPLRIMSAAADVAAEAIKRRECFLCAENLPRKQEGLMLPGGHVLLCNPRPIFGAHFTIVHPEHRPQVLEDGGRPLLDLAERFGGEFAVFYNGAKAGASAPDHLHFQMCPAGSFPLLGLTGPGERIKTAAEIGGLRAATITFCGVKYLLLKSRDREAVAAAVERFMAALDSRAEGRDLVNFIVRYDSGWEVVLIPRAKHRPDCYFLPEGRRLIISPASVELAGVVVVPRRDDFERAGANALGAVFAEVVLGGGAFESIVAATVKG